MNIDSSVLEKTEFNNIFYNKTNGLYYFASEPPIMIPLLDQATGLTLKPIGENRFIDSNGLMYRIGKDLKVKAFLDSYSKGPLKETSPNNFVSETTGLAFYYDADKDIVIPLYIPDNTLESAHIEGDMLVGDKSNRKYKIDDDGTILTEEEINRRYINEQALASLKENEERIDTNSLYKNHQERLENICKTRSNNPLYVKFIKDEDNVYYIVSVDQGETRVTLDDMVFQDSPDFRQDMMALSASTYAIYNGFMSSDTKLRLDGSGLVDYQAFSNNDATFIVNGFSNEEVSKVDTVLKNTKTEDLNQSTSLEQKQGPTLKLTKEKSKWDKFRGFCDTLELVLLMIYTALIGIILAIYLIVTRF